MLLLQTHAVEGCEAEWAGFEIPVYRSSQLLVIGGADVNHCSMSAIFCMLDVLAFIFAEDGLDSILLGDLCWGFVR